MKKIKPLCYLIAMSAVLSALFLFACCGTAPATPEPAPEVAPPVKEVPPAPEPPKPQPALEPAPSKEDLEYQRSVADTGVSKDTFEQDKLSIIQTIKELDEIIKNMDYGNWLKYVDPASIAYYKDPRNLKKVSSKLPIKGMQLKNLEDYFKYVFVQSRSERAINEIRYVTQTSVKAVEAKEEQDVVFYYFNKINGFWLVHLPRVE